MLIYKTRSIWAIRKFSSRPNRIEESDDDDLLFSNDEIQSTHVSKSKLFFVELSKFFGIYSHITQ